MENHYVGFWAASGSQHYVMRASSRQVKFEALDGKPPHVSGIQFPASAIDAALLSKLLLANQSRRGAVADGVTRILLRCTAGAPGTVTFLTSNGVPSEQLTYIDSPFSATDVPTVDTVQLTGFGLPRAHVAFALYTAPDGIQSENLNLNPQQTHFRAVFTPADGGPRITNNIPFELYRPPVLLVHGVWSDSSKWTGPIKSATCLPASSDTTTYSSLNNGGFRPVVADYRASNAKHFSANQYAIWYNVLNTIEEYESQRIAITQLDVVGHSMGGIVTRYFAQTLIFRDNYLNYGNGYIRRFVTLGTPHLGSDLGRMYRDLRASHPSCADAMAWTMATKKVNSPVDQGAVDDLTPGSAALRAINETRIPSHAITSDTDPQQFYFWTCIRNALKTSSTFSDFFETSNCNVPGYDDTSVATLVNSVFLGDGNDRVVSLSSQRGGLSGSHISVITGPTHTDEPASLAVAQRILGLLASPKGSAFADAFPPVGPLMGPTPAPSPNTFVRGVISAGPAQPLVRITTPLEGQLVRAGSTFALTIDAAPSTTARSAFAILEIDDVSIELLITNFPFTTSITIPSTYHGELPIIAYAKDANGNISPEPITRIVMVTTTSQIEGLFLRSTNLVIRDGGLEIPLMVEGVFADGQTRDVAAGIFGTHYSSSEPAVVSISSDGVVTALTNGTAVITITNGAAFVQITVQASLAKPKIVRTITPPAAPGVSLIPVQILGLHLSGALTIEVLRDGVPDVNIVATNLTVDASGSILNANLLVLPSAPYGPRVIRITTLGGVSVSQTGDGNLLFAGFPTLQIEQVANNVVLSWPIALTNWVIQTSGTVEPTANWTTISNAYVGSGNSRIVTNAVSGASKFYRLTR